MFLDEVLVELLDVTENPPAFAIDHDLDEIRPGGWKEILRDEGIERAAHHRRIAVAVEQVQFEHKDSEAMEFLKKMNAKCVLLKNPLIRKNFLIYAIRKNLKSETSLVLYQMGLGSKTEPGLLKSSFKEEFKDDLDLVFNSDNSTGRPIGWYWKMEDTYTLLPPTVDILRGKISYSPDMDDLIKLRGRVIKAITGIKIVQDKGEDLDGNPIKFNEEEKALLFRELLK